MNKNMDTAFFEIMDFKINRLHHNFFERECICSLDSKEKSFEGKDWYQEEDRHD